MACERKNSHREDKTDSGKKPQCDGASSNDMSFLVADWSRWDKYKRAKSTASACNGWWQASLGQSQEHMIAGWSQDDKRVIDAVEDYLDRCVQVIVEIDLVESLLRPENREVSWRYVLKHATFRGSNIFQLFDTSQKRNHFVASRRRWLEGQGSDDAR